MIEPHARISAPDAKQLTSGAKCVKSVLDVPAAEAPNGDAAAGVATAPKAGDPIWAGVPKPPGAAGAPNAPPGAAGVPKGLLGVAGAPKAPPMGDGLPNPAVGVPNPKGRKA